MDETLRTRYVAEISKIISQGFDLGLSSGLISEMIVSDVLKVAVEQERSDWIQIAYAEFGELIQ